MSRPLLEITEKGIGPASGNAALGSFLRRYIRFKPRQVFSDYGCFDV